MPNSYWSTTLIFIRHAQARAADGSYGNDTLLSPFGHEQAQALVAAFTSETVPTVVYTSPYPRAVATAQPLCYHYGITPIVDVRLAEFALPAGSLATVQQRPDLVLWQPDHCGVPDGETLAAFAARVGTSEQWSAAILCYSSGRGRAPFRTADKRSLGCRQARRRPNRRLQLTAFGARDRGFCAPVHARRCCSSGAVSEP